MDGTLADSGEQHWRAWRDAMAADRPDADPRTVRRGLRPAQRTLPPRVAGRDVTADAEIARFGDDKEAVYRRRIEAEGLRALPGAVDMGRPACGADGVRRSPRRRRGPTSRSCCGRSASTTRDRRRSWAPRTSTTASRRRMSSSPPRAALNVPPRSLHGGRGRRGRRRGGAARRDALDRRQRDARLAADVAVGSLDELAPDAFDQPAAATGRGLACCVRRRERQRSVVRLQTG